MSAELTNAPHDSETAASPPSSPKSVSSEKRDASTAGLDADEPPIKQLIVEGKHSPPQEEESTAPLGREGFTFERQLITAETHPRLKLIEFDEGPHLYYVTLPKANDESGEPKKVVSPFSSTGLLKSCFSQFDAREAVDKWYNMWKAKASSKYNEMIWDVLKNDGTEEDAKQHILKSWQENGAEAAAAGTQMHHLCEFLVLGKQLDTWMPELNLFYDWWERVARPNGWKVAGAEVPIFYETDPNCPQTPGPPLVVVSGMIDLLLIDEEGNYVMVDYKRTNPEPKRPDGPLRLLGQSDPQSRFPPGPAHGPFYRLEDNDWGKYTAQANIYAYVAFHRYGIDFRDRMYLLQMHELLTEAHMPKIKNIQPDVESLFSVVVSELLHSRECNSSLEEVKTNLEKKLLIPSWAANREDNKPYSKVTE